MLLTRAISITNFLVASSALTFQVCVLYPWHEQLSEDFEALKKEHLRVLDSIKAGAGVNVSAGGAGDGAGAAAAEKPAHKSKILEMLGR